MKKQIFNYVSKLNNDNSRFSNCGQMVRESVEIEVAKGIEDKNSLAWTIFSESKGGFSVKQLWVITFELLKNESFVEMVRLESMSEEDRFFAEADAAKESESVEVAPVVAKATAKQVKAAKKLSAGVKVAIAKAGKTAVAFVQFCDSRSISTSEGLASFLAM